MAIVYLADDLKHERRVALKVLKPELAAVVGAERFLAEIKTTANLQHPHILPLHDSGEADRFLFYVMPYVEGETLRDRMGREKQLPVDEAVRIATDVAEALHVAHKRGVIHRDIKPANILLSEGRPLVADFGIALAVSAAGGGRLTETGLSMGTPYYMSPEQASADRDPSAASDVYSLGCVLYEMLVGEPPHMGGSAQAVLARILTERPSSPESLRPAVPPNVDAVIRKALEKLPADRFSSALDFAKALADPGYRYGEEAPGEAVTSVGPWKGASLAFATLALLMGALAGWSTLRPEPPGQEVHFELVTPDGRLPIVLSGVAIAVSPDGSRIVYQGGGPTGAGQLWQRSLDDPEAVPIPGTTAGRSPVFSPDGQSILFSVAGGSRKKIVYLDGGAPLTLVEGIPGVGPDAWGPDGVYFVQDGHISRVPAVGGEVEAVTSGTDVRHSSPEVLPDGRGLLLAVYDAVRGTSRIAVVGPEGGEPREILTGVMARYSVSGHIVFATAGGALMAAPFDLNTLEAGDPTMILDGVQSGPTGPQFALSKAGTLVYMDGFSGDLEFVWVSSGGEVTPVDSTAIPGPSDIGWEISPDGRRLAYQRATNGNEDIWIAELPNGPATRLTFDEAEDERPHWGPDGSFVSFTRSIEGENGQLWRKSADNTGSAEFVYGGVDVNEGVWSPGGEWLVLLAGTSSLRSIFAVRPGVDTAAVLLFGQDGVSYNGPSVSRDGRYLAYSSEESGEPRVYVNTFPDVRGGRWEVSAGGGQSVWSRDGNQLFVRPISALAAAYFVTDPAFRILRTTTLFDVPAGARMRRLGGGGNFDVMPDGQRFLLAREVGSEESPSRVMVFLNFSDRLKRLVPE